MATNFFGGRGMAGREHARNPAAGQWHSPGKDFPGIALRGIPGILVAATMKLFFYFPVLCWLLLGVLPVAALDLTVTVKGIRNDQGKISVLAFSNKDGFPDDVTRSLAKAQTDARQGTVTVTLKKLRAGRIALSVLHDEDENGKLNRSIIGVPLEGVAVSGKQVTIPPVFEEAAIEVNKSRKLTITLKYW